ncbi:hypothetical protein T492DRAFT_997839, partial [Pavlovales sp. CCMP2436]
MHALFEMHLRHAASLAAGAGAPPWFDRAYDRCGIHVCAATGACPQSITTSRTWPASSPSSPGFRTPMSARTGRWRGAQSWLSTWATFADARASRSSSKSARSRARSRSTASRDPCCSRTARRATSTPCSPCTAAARSPSSRTDVRRASRTPTRPSSCRAHCSPPTPRRRTRCSRAALSIGWCTIGRAEM